MALRQGVPLISELAELQTREEYRQAAGFNQDFLTRHGRALDKYGRHWGRDPFRLWSRRWEYPFVAGRLIDYLLNQPGGEEATGSELQILDAGSGVTFFPYMVCQRVPRARFVCVDYDSSYDRMFREINANESKSDGVRFLQASLQKLPLPEASLDAVCCISVLEHTNQYGEIIDEFYRVLKPGGAFILTFDLSLDGRFTLPKELAAELLGKVCSKFEMLDGFDAMRELDRMHAPGVLTTDHVRATEPQYLPWSPAAKVMKSVQDLFKGYGWTGGFRSRTVYCIDVRKPHSNTG